MLRRTNVKPMPTNQSKAKVLIVDDDRAVIIALGKALQDIAQTVFASNGTDALLRVNDTLPDLILLDMEMPDICGLDVCDSLKATAETADIPIIIITSHVEPGIEEWVFESGAVDYIAKPLNPRVVSARVKTHLGCRQALAELRQSKTSLEIYNQQLKQANEALEQIQCNLKAELKANEEHRQKLVAQLSESELNKTELPEENDGLADKVNALLATRVSALDEENRRLNDYLYRHLAELEKYSDLQSG